MTPYELSARYLEKIVALEKENTRLREALERIASSPISNMDLAAKVLEEK